MTLEEKAKQKAKEIYPGENYVCGALQGAVEKGYLACAKENQQVIEKAVEIIRELGGIVHEGVICNYLVDYGALHRATSFLKEIEK